RDFHVTGVQTCALPIYIFQEMGAKVKRYKVKESNKDFIDKIEFPQFFIKVAASDIFGTDEELLNRESLLKDFKLSNEDIKIDFEIGRASCRERVYILV